MHVSLYSHTDIPTVFRKPGDYGDTWNYLDYGGITRITRITGITVGMTVTLGMTVDDSDTLE